MNENVGKAGKELKEKAGLEGVQTEPVYNPKGFPPDYPKNDNGPKVGKPKKWKDVKPEFAQAEKETSKSDRLS